VPTLHPSILARSRAPRITAPSSRLSLHAIRGWQRRCRPVYLLVCPARRCRPACRPVCLPVLLRRLLRLRRAEPPLVETPRAVPSPKDSIVTTTSHPIPRGCRRFPPAKMLAVTILTSQPARTASTGRSSQRCLMRRCRRWIIPWPQVPRILILSMFWTRLQVPRIILLSMYWTAVIRTEILSILGRAMITTMTMVMTKMMWI
jgi:hypothetical protein